MKILFITDLYPIGNENISKALFYFVSQWQKMGHTVEVIRPNFRLNTKIRGRKIIKEKIYFENDIKIYNLNFITPFWFNVRNKLPKEFSLKNYDVMISHMPSGALFAKRLLEKEHVKYVCSVHSSDITVLKNLKYALYFRKALKQAYLIADKISARSPVLQTKIEQIIDEVHNKTFVAYSGINSIEIIPDKNFNFDYKNLKICTAASLIKRKNIDFVLKELANLNNNFKYTVMGYGSEHKSLEKLTRKLGIIDKVDFTGLLTREKAREIMGQNDIFIMISNNETFGLAYLEAMLQGNLVIAKKNDGIDGILKDEQNAFLIDCKKGELVKCLEKICNLKETQINKIRNNAIETAKNMTLRKASESYLDNIT